MRKVPAPDLRPEIGLADETLLLSQIIILILKIIMLSCYSHGDLPAMIVVRAANARDQIPKSLLRQRFHLVWPLDSAISDKHS
jgi:hypothetical protein